MTEYFLNETDDTPRIHFDSQQGVLEISGKSLPEDINEFYRPLIERLNQYVENPNDKTTLNFKFEYINSSSSKKILEILVISRKVVDAGKELEINWHYNFGDEDIYEEGTDFAKMLKMDFNYFEN